MNRPLPLKLLIQHLPIPSRRNRLMLRLLLLVAHQTVNPRHDVAAERFPDALHTTSAPTHTHAHTTLLWGEVTYVPLGNLALDAARDALTRVLGGACGGGGGRVEPGGDGGLVGGWWWWWCAAVVHVRVDARVESVGGAGGVRAVGAFGGGLLHFDCGFWCVPVSCLVVR